MRDPFAIPRDAFCARYEPESRTDRSFVWFVLLRPVATVVQQAATVVAAVAAAATTAAESATVHDSGDWIATRNVNLWCRCYSEGKKRPCHAHDLVVASAIMCCELRIITCHENPVVLA